MSSQPRRRRIADKPKPPPSKEEVAGILRGEEPKDTAGDGMPPPVDSFQGGVLPTVPLKREKSSFAALSRKEKLSLLLQGGKRSSGTQEQDDTPVELPASERPRLILRGSSRTVAHGDASATPTSQRVQQRVTTAFPPEQLAKAYSLGEPFSDDEKAESSEEEEKELQSSDIVEEEPFSYSTAVPAAPAPEWRAKPPAGAGAQRGTAATRGAGGSKGGADFPVRGRGAKSKSHGGRSSELRGPPHSGEPRKPVLQGSGPEPPAAISAAPTRSSSASLLPMPPSATRSSSSSGIALDRNFAAGRKKTKAKKSKAPKKSEDKKKSFRRKEKSGDVTEKRIKTESVKPSSASGADEEYVQLHTSVSMAPAAPLPEKDARIVPQPRPSAAHRLAAPLRALQKFSLKKTSANPCLDGHTLGDEIDQDGHALGGYFDFGDEDAAAGEVPGRETITVEEEPIFDEDEEDEDASFERGKKKVVRRSRKARAVQGKKKDQPTKSSLRDKDRKEVRVNRADRSTRAQKEAKVLHMKSRAEEVSRLGRDSSLDDDSFAELPPAPGTMAAAIPYGYSMSYDLDELDAQSLSSSELNIRLSPAPEEATLIASGYDLQKLQGPGDDIHMVGGDSTTEGDDNADEWDGYNYIQVSKITNSLAVEGTDDSLRLTASEEMLPVESGMNWNNLFQDARHQLNDLPRDAELDIKIAAHKRMAHLTSNFEYTAATFGKVIIAERSLPDHAKSIPPFNCGGRVGGEKFLVHGVLFKFAIDVNHILGSDESAMKIAGHELKALNSLVSLGEDIQDLHYPMMALIDYRGYRLIALSQLPISDVTLALGSSDAGRTVYHSDALLLERTTQACQLLNLKSHHVGHRYANATVPGPVDLEGHVGTDGRRYLLDFARLFPPDVPSKDYYCGYLYRLLRPELVKAWSSPLCSDAYSKFVSQYPDEALEHKEEVKAAVAYMTGTVIPEFASILSKTDSAQFMHSGFVDAFHRQGINLRYLGLVRHHIGKDSEWSDYLLVEMIARAFKWRLRAALREARDDGLQLPSDVSHRIAAVDCLNEIFSSPCPSQEDVPDPVWSEWLPRELEHRFPGGLFDHELTVQGALRCHFFSRAAASNSSSKKPHILCRLFDRLDRMLDVTFTTSAKARFSSDPNAFLDEAAHAAPFDFIHISNFSPMVKHLSLMEFTMGKLLLMRAKKLGTDSELSGTGTKAQLYLKPGSDGTPRSSDCGHSSKSSAKSNGHQTQQRRLLMQLSLESFERALECNPSCITTLLLCAGTYAQLGNLQMAKIYYQLAKNVDETNPLALYKYARFLHEHTAEDEEAEDMYLAAIRHSESQQPKPLMHYAKFLATKGDNKEAAHSLFSLAEEVASEKLKQTIERIRQETY